MGWQQPLGFSLHLLNSFSSFASTKVLILIYTYLDDMLVLIHSICWEEGMILLCSLLVYLGLHINFSNLNLILLSTFVSWDWVVIQWVCLYLCTWINSLRYGSWLLPCCRCSHILSGHVLFWQDQFLCQLPCTAFSDYLVSLRVKC